MSVFTCSFYYDQNFQDLLNFLYIFSYSKVPDRTDIKENVFRNCSFINLRQSCTFHHNHKLREQLSRLMEFQRELQFQCIRSGTIPNEHVTLKSCYFCLGQGQGNLCVQFSEFCFHFQDTDLNVAPSNWLRDGRFSDVDHIRRDPVEFSRFAIF